MIEAEEALHSERVRARELEASQNALLEQVEFLKDQEQQRQVSLRATMSPASSSSAMDPSSQDQTLSLLAEHVLDARCQVVSLQVEPQRWNRFIASCVATVLVCKSNSIVQEDLIAASERIMHSEALVDELKEQSLALFSRKSALLGHVQAISAAAAAAVSDTGVNRFMSASPTASPGTAMSPASRDVTSVLKSAVCSLAAAGQSQTMEKQALVAELQSSREQLKEAEDSISGLTQSVGMWQELGQTLRDENSDLLAQVSSTSRRRFKAAKQPIADASPGRFAGEGAG
jgi:hypothetical protein